MMYDALAWLTCIHCDEFLTIFCPVSQWPYELKKNLSTNDASPGVPGGVKNQNFFFTQKVLSYCAKIAPKNHQYWKKCQKKLFFSRPFQIFFNLGAILAQQTSNGTFSGSWCIFRHPGTPVGSSIVEIQEARCHLYWFDMNKSYNITFYSHNDWFLKVRQAVSVLISKESEQISPVWQYIEIHI